MTDAARGEVQQWVGDAVTGSYEHVMGAQQIGVLRGRIEMDDGLKQVVATVSGGTAEIELVEDFDDTVTAFGQAEPIRFVHRRQRLRLTVECALNEMVITTGPEDRRSGVAGERDAASKPTGS